MAGGDGNYAYLIDLISRLGGSPPSKVLDFGCGQGPLLARGIARGFDMVGADTYQGAFHGWSGEIHPDARERIYRISGGVLPFPDNSFNIVIANQVFEHIGDPVPSLAEIHRVLVPGGALVALFPSGDVWFEGHVGLYFPHFFRRWPKLQWHYLRTLRRLGFGYYGQKATPEDWATHMQGVMQSSVWYHSWRDAKGWWRQTFGVEPVSFAEDYMVYRIARVPKLQGLSSIVQLPVVKSMVCFLCHRRAGRVLVTRKTLLPTP